MCNLGLILHKPIEHTCASNLYETKLFLTWTITLRTYKHFVTWTKLLKYHAVVIVKNSLDGLVQPEHHYYPMRRVCIVAVEVHRRANNEMPFG